MKKLIIIVLILSFTSCATYRDLNLINLKIGMTQREVLKVLGKDSALIQKKYATTYGFCRADIWEYGNRDKYYLMTSRKFQTSNPAYKPIDAKKERYWLYFYNQQLKLIKWGHPKDWNGKKDIDSLIVQTLREEQSDNLKTVLRIMSIKNK